MNLTSSLLVVSARDGLGFILLAAGVPKLVRNEQFRNILRNYLVLPDNGVAAVAWAIPCVELTVGGWLIVGVLPADALAAAALGFMIFAVAITVNLARGRRVECGCFGSSSQSEASWRHVGQDVGLAFGALVGAVWFGTDPAIGKPALLVVVQGALLCVVVLLGLRLVMAWKKVQSIMRRIPDVA